MIDDWNSDCYIYVLGKKICAEIERKSFCTEKEENSKEVLKMEN